MAIQFRGFLNTDPPALLEIWRQQPPLRCLSQVIDRKLLDTMVFAKPYFDPAGLILAWDGERPVGFIHVGFGPTDDLTGIDYSAGIVAQLRVVAGEHADEVTDGLWERAKEYLRSHGATECFGGAKFPHAPFYLGLYGGSRIPGVPHDDTLTAARLERLGFSATQRVDVLQIDMQGYRPPISRSLMTVQRQFQVTAIVDPLLTSWWENCTFGATELFGFRIERRDNQEIVGRVMLWEIQPLSTQWGKKTMGLVDLVVTDEHHRRGLATFLVAESFRHLVTQHVDCVELQLLQSQEPAIAFARRIGFRELDPGQLMHCSLSGDTQC